MAGSKSEFDRFLAQEADKSKGVYFPVKAGLLRRLIVREAPLKSLHPNPNDEFCMPQVGPNYQIISQYQQQYVDALKTSYHYYSGDPIIVEKTHPDGYRIVNGHHRWAAAVRIGQKKIPVKVVNLTTEADVKQILEKSKHTKRVALDMDEVIFLSDKEQVSEKELPFLFNNIFKKHLRLGVPALFHYLSKNGYDIWLYSSEYYSTDSVQRYFRRYHVKVDGVLTAIGKRAQEGSGSGKSIEKLITNKYEYTIHIDNESVLQIFRGTKEFREFPLSGEPSKWSQEVMDAIAAMEEETKA